MRGDTRVLCEGAWRHLGDGHRVAVVVALHDRSRPLGWIWLRLIRLIVLYTDSSLGPSHTTEAIQRGRMVRSALRNQLSSPNMISACVCAGSYPDLVPVTRIAVSKTHKAQ